MLHLTCGPFPTLSGHYTTCIVSTGRSNCHISGILSLFSHASGDRLRKAYRREGSLWKLGSIFPYAGKERVQRVTFIFWPLGSSENYNAIWAFRNYLQYLAWSSQISLPLGSYTVILSAPQPKFFFPCNFWVWEKRGTLATSQWVKGDRCGGGHLLRENRC